MVERSDEQVDRDPSSDKDPDTDDSSFGRDAESWLAERGVERRPIRVSADDGDTKEKSPGRGSNQQSRPPRPPPDQIPGEVPGKTAGRSPGQTAGQDVGGGRAQSGRTAAPDAERPPARAGGTEDVPAGTSGGEADSASATSPRLDEQVSKAVAYAHRATAQSPKTESRLRDGMADRDFPSPVIEQAIERCRDKGIVDDASYAAALVDEWSAKGHAPSRLRRDLGKRGFSDEVIQAAVAPAEEQNQDARAYELASERARELGDVDDRTAFRRIAGYLARRGYPEGLARRVTRKVVLDE